MTIEELYDAMCRYLQANDWRREEEGSGWWWKEDAPEGEATIGSAIEQQFDLDGFDTRPMRAWEPYEFWGNSPAWTEAAVNAEQKAHRILTEARLTIAWVGPDGVAASCRGFTDGAVYVLGWLPETGWHCDCPAYRRCAHIAALGMVVRERVSA